MGLGGQPEYVVSMSMPNDLLFARCLKQFERVLTEDIQESIPSGGSAVVDGDQRSADQTG